MEPLTPVSENADGRLGWERDIAAELGKVSVLLVELGFKELLYKGWLREQKQAGSSMQRQVV